MSSEAFPVRKKQKSILRTGQVGEHIPFPTSPVIIAALRALYAGGSKDRWFPDSFGRPRYRYDARDGRITFFFSPPPDFGDRFHISKALYYVPRLAFVYSGSLRAAVQGLSVETADVFLVLMARIAQMRDPANGIATISLDEIADFRGVRVRHGSVRNLHRDFKEEVQRLADLRLTMEWRDYTGGGTITFGREMSDRLLDIVDVEYKKDRNTWVSFRFRCGQALSHFLSPEGLRWVGYYSRSLLKLSPYHEAFIKKVGTYWTLIGIIQGKRGLLPRATPVTILDFCGEDINWRNPGKTVDAFIKAHDRLVGIGVLEESGIKEPPTRTKGYFKTWLETPITVKLVEDLWYIKEGRKHPIRKKRIPDKKSRDKEAGSRNPVRKARELIENPARIRQFRSDCFMRQSDLARALGVKRQTLSRYERGEQSLPQDTAMKLIRIIQQKKDLT